MKKNWIASLLLLISTIGASIVTAQEASTTPLTDEQKEEKAEKEKRAFLLLEQVVDEAQLLRLPENRIRMQIGAAELLWLGNEGRARSLFAQAADSIAEMLRTQNSDVAPSGRRTFDQTRTPAGLRQELVLTVARYDAPLAYQLLAATRTPANELANSALNFEDELEQRLLAQVAALDPKLALQNAEELLAKGKYPRSLLDVLIQLRTKDKEGAVKFEEKLAKRLTASTMLASSDAGVMALSLLQPGPRASSESENVASTKNQPYLATSNYADVMGSTIDAALRATPRAPTNQPRQTRGRGRSANQVGSNSVVTQADQEQSNARRLLSGLQTLLPRIDLVLPARAPAVRQRIAEVGLNNTQRENLAQFVNSDQRTAAGLVAAAAAAPVGLQSQVYRQAARMALQEGNTDLARQIASDYLDGNARDLILKETELRQLSLKADPNAIDEARQILSTLQNDEQRVDLLLQLAGRTHKANPKLGLQLLEEARQLTNKRANSYQQLELQLRVADAFIEVAPDRSFEIIEPGIMQLNELLAAASTLSGFEVSVFRDGEMPLQGSNGLSAMVGRYGQRLGTLATKDFGTGPKPGQSVSDVRASDSGPSGDRAWLVRIGTGNQPRRTPVPSRGFYPTRAVKSEAR